MTSRDQGFISHNTDQFLVDKLSELIDNHVIKFWFFMRHRSEADESQGREHCHVFIRPNKRIDPVTIQNYLVELDPCHPLPRTCLCLHDSNVDDAILYYLHDPLYLKYKHQAREFAYNFEEFKSSDPYYLYELLFHARHDSSFAKWQQLQLGLSDVSQGLCSPTDLVDNGTIGLNQYSNLHHYAADCSSIGYLFRNGHAGHE